MYKLDPAFFYSDLNFDDPRIIGTCHCELNTAKKTLEVKHHWGYEFTSLQQNTTTPLATVVMVVNCVLSDAFSNDSFWSNNLAKFNRFKQNILKLDQYIKSHAPAEKTSLLSVIIGKSNTRKMACIDLEALNSLETCVLSRQIAEASKRQNLRCAKRIGIQFLKNCRAHKQERLRLAGEKLQIARQKQRRLQAGPIIQLHSLAYTAPVMQLRMRLRNMRAAQIIHQACLEYLNPEAAASAPIPTVSAETVNRRHAFVSWIGGGGEGVVNKVKEFNSSSPRALKISCKCSETQDTVEHSQQMTVKATAYMLIHGLSPHVTKVHETFKVRGKGAIHCNISWWSNDALYKGYVMELLDGDLRQYYEAKKWTLNESDRLEQHAFIIQLAFTEKLLETQFNLYPDDGDGPMLRNVFYKNLTPEDTIRGQRLLDYQYWKYTISGHEFYLPRMGVLIKLGDYDQWQYRPHAEFAQWSSIGKASLFFTSCFKPETSLPSLKAMFPKPTDPQATILDIGAAN